MFSNINISYAFVSIPLCQAVLANNYLNWMKVFSYTFESHEQTMKAASHSNKYNVGSGHKKYHFRCSVAEVIGLKKNTS